MKVFLVLLTSLSYFLLWPSTAWAIVNPLSVPNNRFGIHLISTVDDEASLAASLVNSSGGDWGYVTVLIESKGRDKTHWQNFFSSLRRRHLIPLVRIATQPEGNYWKRPYEGEAQTWADFLDSLNWPTKNRYVIIYNEPNQGNEWGNSVDAASYAKELDQMISALKAKSQDFFVLNAGFDASAPQKPPSYEDEVTFLRQMNQTVPGIFNRLDGWVSHSYPNPGYVGSPSDSGRGTVRTYQWELGALQSMGVSKNLPVFITETGWKHAEGINFDPSLPTSDKVGQFLQAAFASAWNNRQVVAVTPFLLNYQDPPFDHFSFEKLNLNTHPNQVLGVSTSPFYPQYQAMSQIGKVLGQPVQENQADLVKGEIYSTLVGGETYNINLTFKNTGQSIWGERGQIKLVAAVSSNQLTIEPVQLDQSLRIEPGQEATWQIRLKAPDSGSYQIGLQLYQNGQAFDSQPAIFNTKVEAPVVLQINASLFWKNNFSGQYFLTAASDAIKNVVSVMLDDQGKSAEVEARYLLPEHTFSFTLQRPFYKPKTISLYLRSGLNVLNFGTLEPDFLSALFKPVALWDLLPFSSRAPSCQTSC